MTAKNPDDGFDLPKDRIPTPAEVDYRFRMLKRERRKEWGIWLLVAALAAFIPPLVAGNILEATAWGEHSNTFLFSLSFVLFLIMFQLIFRRLPLETLRAFFSSDKSSFEPLVALFAEEAELMLTKNVAESKKISEGIYNRAGVYLLVGVIVAFSGLAFFYLQTADVPAGQSVFVMMVAIAPKFGILFFIEIVAFFFLRQYRAAMDEFRYFEGIKRKREEVLVLFKVALEQESDPLELARSGVYFSDPVPLGQGQTTEIIETRKLEKNELALVEKVLDAITARRV